MKYELLKWIKENKIKISDLHLLLSCRDEVIEKIVNCKKDDVKSSLVKVYSSFYFDVQDDDVKMEIIELIKNSKFPKHIAKLVENEDVFESGELLKLSNLIAKSNEELQADYGLLVATNQNVLESGLALMLVDEVVNSNYPSYVKDVATNMDVLKSGNAVNLSRIVGRAKTSGQAYYASLVAVDKNTLERGREGIGMVVAVANAQQIHCTYEVVTDRGALNSGNILPLANLISGISDTTYATIVRDLIKASVYDLDYLNEIVNCEDLENMKYAAEIAKRAHELQVENSLLLVKKIASGEYVKRLKLYLGEEKELVEDVRNAIVSNDVDRLLTCLEWYDNPSQELEDILKLKIKRI